MSEKIWFLKQCNLFQQLTDEQLAELERRAAIRSFKRKKIIYFPAEPGESALVLASGRVKIKDITPDGKEAILAFIEPGELFGELAALDGAPRAEYAEAAADSQVVLIPREDLLALMRERPDLALSITRLIGLRRQRIENRLRNVLFLSSRQRIVRLLLELTETYGDRNGPACTLRLPFSHQDLASLIGVTRETVTLLLGQLQLEQLIRCERRRLILDCEQLAAQLNERAVAPPKRHALRPRREKTHKL